MIRRQVRNHCPICNEDVFEHLFMRHIKSKRHQEKVKLDIHISDLNENGVIQ